MRVITLFHHISKTKCLSYSYPKLQTSSVPFATMPLYVPKSLNLTLNEGQLKAIFKEHDTDGDGCLSKEELSKAFQKLGSRYPGWRVRRALHHADTNGDGSIGIDELDELVKYAVKLGYGVN
ncbi:Calcium-binding EF-hand family protein, putative [Theobroma cacao]|uniref:Calcium-binding EF-hand family protein, putative n=1 Tax=Theobroma cacao TaxID=3641 RepID=A0A061FJ21_THECC|nr:Calcium-binding EF-hand family protein, putative [Theobroma cacao]